MEKIYLKLTSGDCVSWRWSHSAQKYIWKNLFGFDDVFIRLWDWSFINSRAWLVARDYWNKRENEIPEEEYVEGLAQITSLYDF